MIVGIASFTGKLSHPEKEIIGLWKETEWTYEKADQLRGARGSSAVEKDLIRSNLKNEITENLVIHTSESWDFKEDRTLLLTKEDGTTEQLKWHMKGRGHILKLKNESGQLEFYQIRKLGNRKLILHFENDIHARGIVKIVFERK